MSANLMPDNLIPDNLMPDNRAHTCGTGHPPWDAARHRERSGTMPREGVVETVRRSTYRVQIDRDETGAWIARIPSVPGCHTYGRTLDAAKRRIREVLALWVNDADNAELEFRVRIPAVARDAITPYRVAKRRADAASQEEQDALRRAANRMMDAGLSLRDTGALLGLSHQRIAQILDD